MQGRIAESWRRAARIERRKTRRRSNEGWSHLEARLRRRFSAAGRHGRSADGVATARIVGLPTIITGRSGQGHAQFGPGTARPASLAPRILRRGRYANSPDGPRHPNLGGTQGDPPIWRQNMAATQGFCRRDLEVHFALRAISGPSTGTGRGTSGSMPRGRAIPCLHKRDAPQRSPATKRSGDGLRPCRDRRPRSAGRPAHYRPGSRCSRPTDG